MKVTKLKRGYTIRLSDSEYEVLCKLVGHGIADWESDAGALVLRGSEITAFEKRMGVDGWMLRPDDDRR